MKYIISFLFILIYSIGLNAQKITVTGVMTTKDKEPLPGGLVRVVSGIQETSTDIDGNYSIEVLPTDKLRFIYLGFKTQDKKVNNRTVIDVEMQELETELGPSCLGISAFNHSISMLATYSSHNDKFGYAIDYRLNHFYLMPCYTKQKLSNLFAAGLRIHDINPSDKDIKFNPYISINPFEIPLFKYKYNTINVLPYLDIGYYMDTDFNKMTQNNLSYGGGIHVNLKTINIINSRRNLFLSAGYSAFANQNWNNHFYLGLRLNLKGNRGYVII